LLGCKTGKIAEFDQLCFDGVLLFEFADRFVQRKQLLRALGVGKFIGTHIHTTVIATPLSTSLLPGRFRGIRVFVCSVERRTTRSGFCGGTVA
jgi:hypothetical protein